MENFDHDIIGSRQLSEAEIDLINKIKIKGMELQVLVQEVRTHVAHVQLEPQELDAEFSPHRWASMGSTDLQTGLMFLTRAVARPSSF